MTLEMKVLDVIDGKRKATFLFPFLRLCSFFYGSGVALRHLAYHLGICKTQRANTFVISVGNIACGGTGKTPFVRFLTQALTKTCKTAILSRGYRSSLEHLKQPCLISDDQGPIVPATVCGDEPYFLAASLPGVKVWVGKHRYKAAKQAAQQKVDVAILDDGMQYKKLERDIEIAILDGQDILAGGKLLPSGRLRDFPFRLRSADLIVINHAEETVPLAAYQEKLRSYSRAPFISVRMRNLMRSGIDIRGQKVGVFCALGRPERFVQAIENYPAHVVATLFAPDHRNFQDEALRAFARECQQKGAMALVCSSKDAVKLGADLDLELPLVIVDGEMEILQGHETWKTFLESITSMIKQRKSR